MPLRPHRPFPRATIFLALLLAGPRADAARTAPKAAAEGERALACYFGIKRAQDHRLAFSLASAGAESGAPAAIVVKALCVGRGRGTRMDERAAIAMLKPLLEKRDPLACAAAAMIMATGRWDDDPVPPFLAEELAEELKERPVFRRAERAELAGFALRELAARVNEDAVAAVVSGQLFGWGAGAKLDEEKALALYEKAWALGCSDAANQIGLIFHGGSDARRDLAKAREWFRKAAGAGNAVARSTLVNLGFCQGSGEEKLREERELLRASAKAGYPPAMAQLGDRIWRERRDPGTNVEARAWLEEAAAFGERGGIEGLASFLLTTSRSEADRGIARKLLRTGILRGWMSCAHVLSDDLVRDATATSRQYQVAWLLAGAAAEKEFPDAFGTLGQAQELGRLGEPNLARAREFYEKGAARGSSRCELFLGVSYCNAKGAEADFPRGFALLKKSAEHGEPRGMTEAGVCLLEGKGVEKDVAKAVEWLRAAIARGETRAMFFLGAHLVRDDTLPRKVEEGLRLLREAADAGEIGAPLLLCAYFQEGKVVKKDDVEAVRWLRRGVDLRDPGAIFYLARALETGTGAPADADEAWRLLHQAADLRHGLACVRIGDWYREGRRGPPSSRDAAEWYRKAADLGDATGMNDLGYMYQTGDGVPADPARALELYHRAAELGAPVALINLAICHERGIGVAVDLEKARNFRQLAAEKEAAAGK